MAHPPLWRNSGRSHRCCQGLQQVFCWPFYEKPEWLPIFIAVIPIIFATSLATWARVSLRNAASWERSQLGYNEIALVMVFQNENTVLFTAILDPDHHMARRPRQLRPPNSDHDARGIT